jgi:hypothetical protein
MLLLCGKDLDDRFGPFAGTVNDFWKTAPVSPGKIDGRVACEERGRIHSGQASGGCQPPESSQGKVRHIGGSAAMSLLVNQSRPYLLAIPAANDSMFLDRMFGD